MVALQDRAERCRVDRRTRPHGPWASYRPRRGAVAALAVLLAGSPVTCPARPRGRRRSEPADAAAAAPTRRSSRYYEQDVELARVPRRHGVRRGRGAARLRRPRRRGDHAVACCGCRPRTPTSGSASLVVNPGGPGVSGVDYAAAAEAYFGERAAGRLRHRRVRPARRRGRAPRSTASPTRSSTRSSPPTPIPTPRREARGQRRAHARLRRGLPRR